MRWDFLIVRGALAGVFALLIMIVHLAAWGLASRGVHVSDATCGWDDGRYVVTARVKNTERVVKDVRLSLQARAHPSRGQSWPNLRTRLDYAATSRSTSVFLQPGEERSVETTFELPVEGFACGARANINGQTRGPRAHAPRVSARQRPPSPTQHEL